VEKSELNEGDRIDGVNLYDLWVVLKKRRIIILLISLISLSVSIAYVTLEQKVYRVSNAIVLKQVEEFITKAEVIATIRELNGLLKPDNQRSAQLLSMQLNDIQKINASDIKETSIIRVDIDAFNAKTGIALMKALPQYLQSTPNISRKLAIRQELMEKNRENLKAIIDNPMKDLRLSSNTIVYVPSIDLYHLHERYNALNIMIQEIKEGRILSLARESVPPVGPLRPRMRMRILSGLVLGIFLGVFVAFFMEWLSSARQARGLK